MTRWTDMADRMDRSVIKKDGTATDIEYFMATHVPFQDLEFVEFGETEFFASSSNPHLTEEEIYEKYIVDKANKHQMLIVRGTNGTGKSHLICWLYNQLIADRDNFDDSREKVIFLRRLDNTIRGAMQQMLDEGLVQEAELREKFRRFCETAQSQDENEFKITIYNAYAMRVATDTSGQVYKPILCRNISSFLHDSRVQEYMMRQDGPIDRCYKRINSGADRTGETGTIFTEKDFDFPPEVAKSIKKESAEEVRGFYIDELRGDSDAIAKLVAYLNKYTSAVMQSCANISSENARDLFVNLRKSLYAQGKNLTLFIEDFTSLSIVESELLTALVVENGGKYSDLCRVSSVIGITDGYYDSFRDNFKNRVTKQIIVNEQAFSDDRFVLEMAARYLNAVYCSPEQIKSWYDDGAYQDELPDSGFKPGFAWDYVNVQGRELTLYPFNRKSIIGLYNRLKIKTPRYFLEYVIRYFFSKFADGMEYGEGWEFPELPGYIRSTSMEGVYANSVEKSTLSEKDQQRLKILLATWGDRTSQAMDGNVGGVPYLFIQQIGLGAFRGIGVQEPGGQMAPVQRASSANVESGAKSWAGGAAPPAVKSKEEVIFEKRIEDIESWYEDKKQLAYSADFNRWVRDFVVQGIPWQDEEIPGAFVDRRYKTADFVSIEGAVTSNREDKSIVSMKRDPETRDILTALAHFNYYGHWDFKYAAYYQMKMVSWLKKNTDIFKERIVGRYWGSGEQPIITWCLAVEYIQRLIMGEDIGELDRNQLLHMLIKGEPKERGIERRNAVWNNTITFLENSRASVEEHIRTILKSGSNSMMSVIGDSSSRDGECYRTNELYASLEHLREVNWDIRGELPDKSDSHFYMPIVNHLWSLYDKLARLVEEEKKLAQELMVSLERTLGEKPNRQALSRLIQDSQTFFNTCGTANVPYKTELKMKFEEEPIVYADKVMKLYNAVAQGVNQNNMMELLKVYSGNPCGELGAIVDDMAALEKFAQTQEERHKNLQGNVEPIDPLLVESALEKLGEISEIIEKLEVGV